MKEGFLAIAEALMQPVLDPASRTWWGGLLVAALVAAVVTRRTGLRRKWAHLGNTLRHSSAQLDLQLMWGRQLLGLIRGTGGVAGAWWLATHLVRWMDGLVGAPTPSQVPQWVLALIYSLVLFVARDASRFALHWCLHRVDALWAFHQVHHSAEVLTPLTFHRLHPVESWLYQLRGVLVTGTVTAAFFWAFRGAAIDLQLMGVPALGLVLNVIFGNLRHSHVWLRFPAAVERWCLSPAQHQLHHSADPAHRDTNFGTWLALWDRLADTLIVSERPPHTFGIAQGERNHQDDLLSAWFGPFRALWPSMGVLATTLLVAGPVQAQPADPAEETEPTEETEPESPPPSETPTTTEQGVIGMTMLVVEDGNLRVAGSAHAVDEETLERFEYNNIEQIVAEVPGVTSRNEDGFGLRPNLGIRGANSDRSAKITLMEDGVLLAPAPYAAPAAYYFPMSTRMVAVEVFKGPASIRHGPNTVGGAINLRTREVPEELETGLDLAGGLQMTGKVHGYVGTSSERSGVLAEVVHLRSNGFKELDNDGPTGFDHTEAMLKGWWGPAPAHRLELKLGFANETSNETYLGLTADDLSLTPNRRYAASALGLMNWNRTQAELAWHLDPNPNIEIRTVAYHHYLSRSWTKLNGFSEGPDLHDLLQADPSGGQSEVYLAVLKGEEDTTTSGQSLMIETNDRRYHSAGIQTAASWEVVGDRVSSRLDFGARIHHDMVSRLHTQRAYGMNQGTLVDLNGVTETTTDSQATATALAMHAHEDLVIGELHLLPGARVEFIRTQLSDEGDKPGDPTLRPTVLPGFAALHGITDDLDVFGGVHRGFSPVAPGQPSEVQPEVSWNYEAGVRWSNADRQAEFVAFFNDYKNLTGTCTLSGGCDGDQVGQQYNGGDVWVYGAEATASWTLQLPVPLEVPLSGSYSWTQSSFRTGFVSEFPQFGTVGVGDSLPYVPEHQGQGRATLQHEQWSVSVGVTARSAMLNEAGGFPATDQDIPPLVLVDAAAQVNLGESFTLYGTGTNLTNTRTVTSWRPYGARPTAPLLVMVGLKWRPPTSPEN